MARNDSDRNLLDARRRERYWWPLLLLLAAGSYLYRLDGIYIPHIGDEAPYLEITRLTAESGSWLPLRTAPDLENTKPPLLFWTGIVTTDWGHGWSLMRLRLPIVLITFATALVVFVLSGRLGGRLESGYLGALTFLGCASTFQYGRPFLTNQPETFFLFLPFALLVVNRERRLAFWVGCGSSMGIACLFKSFALVVPMGLALAWLLLSEGGFHLKTFLRRDAPKVALATAVALGCFALWPLLDPDPGAILRHFVLEENFGKLGGGGYLSGLVTWPYPLWRIWLGHVANGGLFALPFLYLAAVSLWRRKELSREECALWIFVLSFLLVYSVPSQRQENYLLPTVPALAVLLAIRWTQIRFRWFLLFSVPVLVVLFLTNGLIGAIDVEVLDGAYMGWQRLLPLASMLFLGFGLLRLRSAPFTFHASVILTLWCLNAFLAPFNGAAGKYPEDRLKAVRSQVVYVPSNFISKHERHRFILPGTRIQAYDPADTGTLNKLLDSRSFVALQRPLGEKVTAPYRVYARRLDLKTRQPWWDVVGILVHKDLDLLIQQELIVRRYRAKREQAR